MVVISVGILFAAAELFLARSGEASIVSFYLTNPFKFVTFPNTLKDTYSPTNWNVSDSPSLIYMVV